MRRLAILHTLRTSGRSIVVLRLDVTDADKCAPRWRRLPTSRSCLATPARAWDRAGGPNVLDHAQREMEVNYFGALRLLQSLAPTLARNGGGAFVTVASVAGLTNIPFLPTYARVEGGAAFAHSGRAHASSRTGHAIFGVYPGPIDTDMSRALSIPKTSARDVRSRFLTASKPDRKTFSPTVSLDFGRSFEASPKASEHRSPR